jgi:hypothetical protein
MYIIVYRHNKEPAYFNGKRKPVLFKTRDAARRKAQMMNDYFCQPGSRVPLKVGEAK